MVATQCVNKCEAKTEHILRADKEVDLLLNVLLDGSVQRGALGAGRVRRQVGREENQLSQLRLGNPSLCARGVVMQNWLSVEEAGGCLLLMLR